VPPQPDIGQRYRWNREDIFSSGALTLGELLGRIPGVTAFASGWVASPQTNTYVGDFRRIRLFYDGVELDPLDVRIGPMHDFAAIPMWTLEELVVERAAEELRVYMRSWRVNKTTPYTRVDQIFIAGGSATLPGLAEAIAERTQVPTEIYSPFQGMEISSSIREKQLRGDAPALLVATGLALRGFDA
jgi:hypothetical protein